MKRKHKIKNEINIDDVGQIIVGFYAHHKREEKNPQHNLSAHSLVQDFPFHGSQTKILFNLRYLPTDLLKVRPESNTSPVMIRFNFVFVV